MSDLAPMREQVYTDPRPKEYFDRFHERARTREPDWVYELVRVLTSLYAYTFLRARSIAAENVPGSGAGDPRAQPLLVHGPLPDRLLHPPQGPLHGQVAAVQTADAVHLHPRRRVPGAPRRARRGDVHHRRDDPRARRRDRDVLRGRALAHGQARRAGQARASAAWRSRPARRSCRSRSTAPRSVRNWKRLQFPKVTVQYGEPIRWERVEDPTREQQQAVADEILARDPARCTRGLRGARPQGASCSGCAHERRAAQARRGSRLSGEARRAAGR